MTTSKEFGELIRKYTNKLTEGLSPRKIASMDHMDLNKEAIKLAQEEVRRLNA